MEQVLGNIYCWFESLFGQHLGNHLWGFDGSEYTKPILFNSIGLVAFGISLLFVLLYYYVINHPRFNRSGHWFLILVLNGFVNLFIGYEWTMSDLLDGNIADNLMYVRDAAGEITSTLITSADCWGFGTANFLVATFFFVGLTFCLKWGSRNCKHSPCL